MTRSKMGPSHDRSDTISVAGAVRAHHAIGIQRRRQHAQEAIGRKRNYHQYGHRPRG
jgi:hypothetical protein